MSAIPSTTDIQRPWANPATTKRFLPLSGTQILRFFGKVSAFTFAHHNVLYPELIKSNYCINNFRFGLYFLSVALRGYETSNVQFIWQKTDAHFLGNSCAFIKKYFNNEHLHTQTEANTCTHASEHGISLISAYTYMLVLCTVRRGVRPTTHDTGSRLVDGKSQSSASCGYSLLECPTFYKLELNTFRVNEISKTVKCFSTALYINVSQVYSLAKYRIQKY